ncbi:MAG TPA: hypothetical protein VNM16_13970 [Bacillota bacterium]|nr:hypothetical protein [Bacillota bacterium]
MSAQPAAAMAIACADRWAGVFSGTACRCQRRRAQGGRLSRDDLRSGRLGAPLWAETAARSAGLAIGLMRLALARP